MPSEKTDELLPCPFCGSSPAKPYYIGEERGGIVVKGYYTACFTDDCGAEMLADTPEQLIKRWNRRLAKSFDIM